MNTIDEDVGDVVGDKRNVGSIFKYFMSVAKCFFFSITRKVRMPEAEMLS